MKIGAIQKTTFIDYPGVIACTIFTQGCNFRCGYCHNPELVNPDKFETPIDTAEFFEFLNSRKGKLQGVCITGGEPTIHRDLPEFISQIKDLNYLVKLDTNGSNPKMLKNMLKNNLVDFISMDIKGPLNKYDEISHPKTSIKNIEESIKILLDSSIEYEFRTTIVKNQLISEDFHTIGKMIKGTKHYYLQPFIPSKTLEYSFINRKSYSKEELEEFCTILSIYNINSGIR